MYLITKTFRYLPRKFSTQSFKAFHALSSIEDKELVNCWLFKSLKVSGPTNTPSLTFASDSFGKVSFMIFIGLLSECNALTMLLNRPSFMCNGGIITLSD